MAPCTWQSPTATDNELGTEMDQRHSPRIAAVVGRRGSISVRPLGNCTMSGTGRTPQTGKPQTTNPPPPPTSSLKVECSKLTLISGLPFHPPLQGESPMCVQFRTVLPAPGTGGGACKTPQAHLVHKWVLERLNGNISVGQELALIQQETGG